MKEVALQPEVGALASFYAQRGDAAAVATRCYAVRQHDSVDCTCAGANDGLDGDALVLEQAFQYAPGKGTV